MMLNGCALNSTTLNGGLFIEDVIFTPDKSVIVVSNLFNKRLIEYFMQYPHEMKQMYRRKFEELVAEIFHNFGYKVELTQQTRDGGKDIIAISNENAIRNKYLIECK